MFLKIVRKVKHLNVCQDGMGDENLKSNEPVESQKNDSQSKNDAFQDKIEILNSTKKTFFFHLMAEYFFLLFYNSI